ncbi:MAG: hypothetical protein NT062_35115 [Proteobacteria bacterium]|nr:hypothetical protein [Pseudomonadota bacterium]
MQRPDFDAPASEWLVYGDSLQLTGDPRGELIGLVHAVNEGRTGQGVLDAYVRAHGRALFGFEPHDTYTFDWHYATLRGVTIRVRPDQAEPVAPLLALELARDLRAVTLVGVTASPRARVDLAPSMAALRAHAPATCTTYAFVDDKARSSSMLVSRDFDPDANLVTFGPIAPFFEVAEHLVIECADSHELDLGTLDAPNLRSFALRCLRLAGYEDLEDIGTRLNAATFRKLTTFELRLVEQFNANVANEVNPYVSVYSGEDWDGRDDADDGDSEGIDWNVLGALFATLAKCPLERLALTSFVSGAPLIAALVAAGLPASLTTLDLSDSALADDDVAAILDNRDRLGGVTHLVLERTEVTDKAADKLRKAGFTVTHSTAADAPSWRYIVGSE